MRREVEVDTRLAELFEQTFDAERTIGWKVDALHRALGERQERGRSWRDMVWPTGDNEAIAQAEAISATAPDTHPEAYDAEVWKAMGVRKALDDLRVAEQVLTGIRAEARPLQAEYEATRWPRFFLVTNSNGHIHSSMHCVTTFPTTRWAWLPDLSGTDEETAVGAHGPRLCSVCYPSAPVEWTMGLPQAPRCEGSGKRPAPGYERYRSQPCSVCGKAYPVGNTGVVRAHKPKKEA